MFIVFIVKYQVKSVARSCATVTWSYTIMKWCRKCKVQSIVSPRVQTLFYFRSYFYW